MSRLSAWNIAIGQWFFRYRNAAFPIVFGLIALLLRPRILFGHPVVDRWLVIGGAVLALMGEVVRLLTIGFDYVERGGKEGRVWASRLVQDGLYAHTRNPMYLGNLLIAIGMGMVTGAPAAYLIVIPLFAFIYQAIMAAEEAYLRQKFGTDYVAYCRQVPRLIPSLRGRGHTFAGVEYHWRRAVRKDLSTITGLLLGLMCLPLWRTYVLEGFEAAKAKAPTTLGLVLAVLFLYGLLCHLKKHKLFFYTPAELSPNPPEGPR